MRGAEPLHGRDHRSVLHTVVYNTALPNGREGDGGGLGGWSTMGRGSVRAL